VLITVQSRDVEMNIWEGPRTSMALQARYPEQPNCGLDCSDRRPSIVTSASSASGDLATGCASEPARHYRLSPSATLPRRSALALPSTTADPSHVNGADQAAAISRCMGRPCSPSRPRRVLQQSFRARSAIPLILLAYPISAKPSLA
jgi:hypothetical protein